ncbi:hypothetical protein PENPOL_c003G09508 [Penicillium polonicum]|uniref:Uncharacterized protein n=1 Tax=Penicillium polonicum TaxID=60169 RepID=A0A1V6NTQ7_PENPO|nr:hypothetical protein PENPOL_c003G09508 [Penicillium polonicum]
MAETQAQPHAFLRSLVQQARDLEPDFPSPDDFQRLGIKAFQVSLAPENDKGLQFEPCFFRPHPDKLFQKYPIYPFALGCDPQEMQYSETLKDFIKDALTEHSPANALIVARMEYEFEAKLPPERDPFIHAEDVEGMIEAHIQAIRYGPHEWFSLRNLRGDEQEYWDPDRRENDPPTYEGFGDPKPWRVINHCRYTSRPGKPHSIMSCIAQVWPDAGQGLTTHELRAIVNMMLLRVNHKPFRRCHIHPILVLSFMGDHQGRIIQASYDGKGLILQYSQLWSFEDIKKAPVELFVRYRLSKPVGGVRTLSL